MPPVIRLSDETWRWLQGLAVPLEDTAEDVIRRLLQERGVPRPKPTDASVTTLSSPPQRTRHQRLERGKKTPDPAYKPAVLQALGELGGRAPVGQVLAIVERIMAPQLSDVDRERLSSGSDFRWRNSAQWARNLLKNDGLLRDNSPHGIWELSDKGWKYLENGGKERTG